MLKIKWENITTIALATMYLISRLIIWNKFNLFNMIDIITIAMVIAMTRYIVKLARKEHLIKDIKNIFRD